MKVLITGASGFVGNYLAAALESAGHTVIPTDLHTNPPLDIASFDQCREVLDRTTPDVIYHLAAISFVPAAQKNFDNTLKINVSGTRNVLEACTLAENKPRVIYISSGEVYGRIDPKDLPVNEDVSPKPANYYSTSKLMAEKIVSYYFQEQGLRGVILRPFNHIGAGQNENFVTSTFAKQLAQIKKTQSKPLIQVGNLEAKRDFTAVEDIIDAYVAAASKGSGIYNLGSGVSVEIQHILDTLIEIADLEVDIQQDPERMRPSQVAEITCDPTKAEKELGWRRQVSLRESLQRVYQYWYDRV